MAIGSGFYLVPTQNLPDVTIQLQTLCITGITQPQVLTISFSLWRLFHFLSRKWEGSMRKKEFLGKIWKSGKIRGSHRPDTITNWRETHLGLQQFHIKQKQRNSKNLCFSSPNKTPLYNATLQKKKSTTGPSFLYHSIYCMYLLLCVFIFYNYTIFDKKIIHLWVIFLSKQV